MKPLSRRTFVKIGGLGLSALAGAGWWNRLTALARTSNALTPTLSCTLSPEMTEGPYYIPKELVRRNITEGRPGSKLTLKFTVEDATTCKPIKGAAVDIWHCDAGGIYSGFEAASAGGPGGGSGPTDKDRFLRGVQKTNAKGQAQFVTVYPGWYRGRTVHIHVKVHLGGDTVGHVVHTGQLFFNDSFTAKVYESSPYKSRAASRDTFNNGDGIFQSGGKQSMLTVKSDGKGGYIGNIVLGVKKS